MIGCINDPVIVEKNLALHETKGDRPCTLPAPL